MLCDSRGSSRRRSCHLTGLSSHSFDLDRFTDVSLLEMLAHFYQWEALSTPFQCSTCTGRTMSRAERKTPSNEYLLSRHSSKSIEGRNESSKASSHLEIASSSARRSASISFVTSDKSSASDFASSAPVVPQDHHAREFR